MTPNTLRNPAASSSATIPALLLADESPRLARKALIVLFGVLALSALARISIPLPFTPVPVTGQTFGVTLIALLYGRKLGASTVGTYLALGLSGLPVFSPLGASLGPTLGYLVGMLASSWIVGKAADLGATASWKTSIGAGFLGSVAVYGFGLAGLSFFVPGKSLLWMGLIPFIPGDIVKTSLAGLIANTAHRRARR